MCAAGMLRRGGAVRYDWITDGTRWINKLDSYDDLDQMLEAAAASYRRSLWHSQAEQSERQYLSAMIGTQPTPEE